MLQARQIECVRGNRRLFRDLSFRLDTNQALRVGGENGSGKSSLLRMVAGLAPVEAGAMLWNDRRIAEVGEDFRRNIVFIGHANGLKDDLTAVENLRFALALTGSNVGTAALREVLVRQGLGGVADLAVRLLSQGQKRRVALCRLLFSADKPLWVLDEPFAALDAASVERTAGVIVEHVRRGGMVIFTTHQDAGLADIPTQSLELGAG